MPMIANRGVLRLGEAAAGEQDQLVLIEAYDTADRMRVHALTSQDWQLVSLARRRDADGRAFTEYQLRAPRRPAAG